MILYLIKILNKLNNFLFILNSDNFIVNIILITISKGVVILNELKGEEFNIKF